MVGFRTPIYGLMNQDARCEAKSLAKNIAFLLSGCLGIRINSRNRPGVGPRASFWD